MQITATVIDKTADSLAQVRISVTSKLGEEDNIDVTGYCITSNSSKPQASNSCFGDSREWTKAIGPAWHVWARDAAGNVSAGMTDGPCSSDAKAAAAASTLPTVCIMTDAGEIVLELENTKAPKSADNFMNYVFDGFYADTVFHRILTAAQSQPPVVQGGGFASLAQAQANPSLPKAGIGSPIKLEKTADTGLTNVEKTIAMARTSDPDSATSQFFINMADNSKSWDSTATNDGYAAFGRVIYGFDDAVQAIYKQPLNGDKPTTSIFIRWAYLIN